MTPDIMTPDRSESLITQAEQHRALYHKRREAGLCVKCGAPAVEGYVRCEACLRLCQRYRERYRKGLTTPPRRMMYAEEYTPEEIADIQRDDVTAAAIAAKYSVAYDQILFIKKHKGDPLSGIRKLVFKEAYGWFPLEPPKGDINKLCGCCKSFSDYKLHPERGIEGICQADGKYRHRCDECTRPEGWEALGGLKTVRVSNSVLGAWYDSDTRGDKDGRKNTTAKADSTVQGLSRQTHGMF